MFEKNIKDKRYALYVIFDVEFNTKLKTKKNIHTIVNTWDFAGVVMWPPSFSIPSCPNAFEPQTNKPASEKHWVRIKPNLNWLKSWVHGHEKSSLVFNTLILSATFGIHLWKTWAKFRGPHYTTIDFWRYGTSIKVR